MDLRELLISLSIPTMVFTGLYYGWRFLKLDNPLLGWEWVILGVSAFSMWMNHFGLSPHFLAFSMFCDAFSRTVGMPIIASLGLLQLTHGLVLSTRAKVALFVGGAVVAAACRLSPQIDEWLAIGSMVIGLGFYVVIFLFARALYRRGLNGHAALVLFSSVPLTFIALLEGVIQLPGEEHNLILNFMFLAHLTWALVFGHWFYAYRALHLSEARQPAAQPEWRQSAA
ncbi:MAG: hypothetical protein E6Q93_13230 [Burkholderiaceae bacterium]|nr:MAG: hypothetical protein E6Q93_13230 [Burkholderiaceae bacterium]